MSAQQALEELTAVQARYVRFGACDTEPRGVVAELLESVRRGDVPAVPTTAAGWQLFSEMAGSETAAAALHAAGAALVEAAKSDAAGLARYLASGGL